MTQRHGSQSKDEALLVSVAESIGSTLGTIAAKANAAPKALSDMAQSVEREGKRLTRKTQSAARKLTGTGARKLRRNKPAKAAKRKLRRAASSVKRAVRSAAGSKKSTRRKTVRGK
jgi:hypothetical protein